MSDATETVAIDDLSVVTEDDPSQSPVIYRGPRGDEVAYLLEWGNERLHSLPRPPFTECHLGVRDTRELEITHLRTPFSQARLICAHPRWLIRALDSEHGLRQDGEHREEFVLTPGVEIGIGSTTLIAGSPCFLELRNFCSRILGWQCNPSVVDRAMRTIRFAVARRAPLLLVGDGDLVPVAHALHRRVLGDSPFVVCDPRRGVAAASVRSPENHFDCAAALERATGGSLCVRSRRIPYELDVLLARLHEQEPELPVQLVVCLDRSERRFIGAGLTPIRIPPLHERAAELPEIIEAYANEAIAMLRAPKDCFTTDDLWWVAAYAATSLAEIEKATTRIVAIKASHNMSDAAERLGMAPVSLSRWLGRRDLLPHTRREARAGR